MNTCISSRLRLSTREKADRADSLTWERSMVSTSPTRTIMNCSKISGMSSFLIFLALLREIGSDNFYQYLNHLIKGLDEREFIAKDAVGILAPGAQVGAGQPLKDSRAPSVRGCGDGLRVHAAGPDGLLGPLNDMGMIPDDFPPCLR